MIAAATTEASSPVPCAASNDAATWTATHTWLKAKDSRWRDPTYLMHHGAQRVGGRVTHEAATCRGCGSTLYREVQGG